MPTKEVLFRFLNLVFAVLAVMGVVCLVFFSVTYYWLNTWSIEYLTVQSLVPQPFLSNLMMFSLYGGPVFVTIGVIGIGVQKLKNHKKKFAAIAAFLIPLLLLGGFIVLIDSAQPSRRMAITYFSIDKTDPLTVSVGVKSLCISDIWIYSARIKDCNQTVVASIVSEQVLVNEDTGSDGKGVPYYTWNWLNLLSPGSEDTFTLNFNTTLPPGSYTLSLYQGWREESPASRNFAIP